MTAAAVLLKQVSFVYRGDITAPVIGACRFGPTVFIQSKNIVYIFLVYFSANKAAHRIKASVTNQTVTPSPCTEIR